MNEHSIWNEWAKIKNYILNFIPGIFDFLKYNNTVFLDLYAKVTQLQCNLTLLCLSFQNNYVPRLIWHIREVIYIKDLVFIQHDWLAILRPPSLSELTPYQIQLDLTHLETYMCVPAKQCGIRILHYDM